MAFAFHAGALLAGVSGIVLAVVGGAALAIRPRTRAGWAFAILAILWGLQVVAASLARAATDESTMRAWSLGYIALLIPLHLPLVALLASHPWRHPRIERGLALVAVLSLALLAALVLRPEWFVAGALRRPDGFFQLVPGPLFFPVSVGNSVLAFAFALLVVVGRLRRAPSHPARDQLHLLALALAPYVAYRGVTVVGMQLAYARALWPLQGAPTFLLVVAMGAVALAAAARVVVSARGSHPHPRAALWLVLAPAAVGALEVAVRPTGVLALDTVGIWRLIAVAVLGFGIARYRLFDLDVKLQRVAPAGALIAFSIIGFEVLWNGFGPSFDASPVLAMVATLGFELMVLGGTLALHRRWPRLTGAEASPADRRLTIYQAALDGALLDGSLTPREEGMLVALRRELGLTDADHDRLVAARGSAPAVPAV